MNTHTVAFFAHIPHCHIDEIINKLIADDYVDRYLIGLEVADSVGQHMHFVIKYLYESDRDKWYHAFSKWFKGRYNLSGRAYKNKAKQYGKVKDIRDLEKMETYTVKDKNVRSNYSDEEIKLLISKSYEKEDLKGYYTWFITQIADFENIKNEAHRCFKKSDDYKIMSSFDKDHYLQNVNNIMHRISDIKIYIIKLLKDKNTDSITKGKVNSIFHRYITQHWNDNYIFIALYKS